MFNDDPYGIRFEAYFTKRPTKSDLLNWINEEQLVENEQNPWFNRVRKAVEESYPPPYSRIEKVGMLENE